MKLPSLGLGFPWNFIAAGVAVLGLVAAITFGTVQCKKIDASNTNSIQQTGVVKERDAGHQEVIQNVQKAHEAVTNPTPAERGVVCSKYDRNCKIGK